jgi:tRNA/tmRNA/rRNA uracil-C5-methylase (TrmA/RlmC/RlmD family)
VPTPDPLIGTVVELEVQRVAHEGVCVARLDGRVVFLRHALPGERVRALITDGQVGRPLRGDVVEVLDPSEARVIPPCRFAGPGLCGGCDWQHASLQWQRDAKAQIIREQLSRLAGLEVDVVVEPLPEVKGAAGPGLGWRTRLQLAVGADGRAGLRRHRSHEVQAIDMCLIAHPRVTEIEITGVPWPDASRVEAIVSHTDRALVVTPATPDAEVTIPPLGVDTAVLRVDRKGRTIPVRGRPGVRERAADRTWRVSGSGFWQVHPHAAQILSDAVLAALEPADADVCLDLYCGVGLFAGALAQVVAPRGTVTAVEADAQAAEDARHNLDDLPAVVLTGRVEQVLLTMGIRSVDLIVLDPPRSGAGASVMTWMCSLTPRRIAYVSCDPASLARDVATAAALGYRLDSLRAFDCFPMTQHVESLAVLVPA